MLKWLRAVILPKKHFEEISFVESRSWVGPDDLQWHLPTSTSPWFSEKGRAFTVHVGCCLPSWELGHVVDASSFAPIRLVEGGEKQFPCGWKLLASTSLCWDDVNIPNLLFRKKIFSRGFLVPPQVVTGMLDGTSYLACCSKETAGRKWNYCKILKSKQNQDVERSLPGATFPKAFSLRNTEGNAYHGVLVFWSFGQTLPRLLEVPPWSCRSHHTALELVWV